VTPIKIVQFFKSGQKQIGIWTQNGIIPLPTSFQETVSMIMDHKDSEIHLLLEEATHRWRPDDMDYAPCIPLQQKIICVGLNYEKHAKESGFPSQTSPVLFSKFGNSLSGHGQNIVLPQLSREYDYEGELGVVIGRKGKNVAEENALDFVLGYCNANDLSARDLQNRTSQWLLGKSLDGFCPIGPYIVTKDEIENPNELTICTYVNGEVRQQSNTNDMIFSVEEIVSYVSHYITLEPGDLILTGTPEGVILGYPKEKRSWLKAGDQVTVEIEKLGCLTNHLVG
jgi:2-keto-4-pentenoate hydratase/2-oxohepta-3-ene-1,7-dioic acid hydratase in catechol pathway